MATVTITITDHKEDGISVKLVSLPPMPDKEEDFTLAQDFAAIAITHLEEIGESVGSVHDLDAAPKDDLQ